MFSMTGKASSLVARYTLTFITEVPGSNPWFGKIFVKYHSPMIRRHPYKIKLQWLSTHLYTLASMHSTVATSGWLCPNSLSTSFRAFLHRGTQVSALPSSMYCLHMLLRVRSLVGTYTTTKPLTSSRTIPLRLSLFFVLFIRLFSSGKSDYSHGFSSVFLRYN